MAFQSTVLAAVTLAGTLIVNWVAVFVVTIKSAVSAWLPVANT